MPLDLAKINPPVTSPVLTRERLHNRLDGERWRLALFYAQKGQGKSTLAADYLRRRGCEYVWYNLDPGDVNMRTLLDGLTHGLARRRKFWFSPPPASNTITLREKPASLAADWIELNLDCIDDELIVVLDDCERAPSGAAVLVRSLLEHARPNVRVLALSSASLPLGRSPGAGGDSLELGNDDLKFTWDEARDLFRGTLHSAVDEDLLREVWRLSEGWAVGLLLFGQYVKRKRDGSLRDPRPLDLEEHREAVFHFFAESVFDSVTPEVRTFLMTTSLFENIYLPLPREIRGTVDAGELLERMKENNLFTASRGPECGAYSYHPLFRSFLRSKFASTFDPEWRRKESLVAATFLRSRRKPWEAFEVLVENRLYAEAAEMIEETGRDLYAGPGPGILAKWPDSLPRGLMAGKPWLTLLVSQSERNAAPEKSLAGVVEALECFEASGDARGIAVCLANLAEMALFSDWVDVPPRRIIEEVNGLIGRADLEQYPYRALLLFAGGLHDLYLGHELVRGTRSLLLAAAIDEENADVQHAVLCLFYAAILLLHQGEIERAREVRERARSLAAGGTGERVTGVLLRVVEAGIFLFSGRFQEGAQVLDEVEGEVDRRGLVLVKPMLEAWRYWLSMLGREEEAGDSPTADFGEGPPGNTLQKSIRLLHQGLLNLRRGLPPREVAESLEVPVRALRDAGTGFFLWFGMFVRGVALAQAGEVEQATAILRKAAESSGEGHAEQLRVSIDLFRASLLLRGGSPSSGEKLLRRAMPAAERAGFGFFFCFPPGELAELCTAAVTRRTGVGKAWEVLASLPPRFSEATLRRLSESDEPRIRKEFLDRFLLFDAVQVRERLRLLDSLAKGGDAGTAEQAIRCAESLLVAGPPLRFALLGGFSASVWGDRIDVERWRSRNVVHLLKLLCVHFPGSLARDKAAETLWPEGRPGAVLLNLRVTLSKLRKALDGELGVPGLSAISATREHVGLNPLACRVDLAEFREEHRRAMARWSAGDQDGFLPSARRGVDLVVESLAGGTLEPEWMMEVGAETDRRFQELLWHISLAEEARGNGQEAIEALERILRHDGLREDACVRLMTLLGASGKRAEALRVYQACRRSLGDELGVEPEPATRELFESLRGRAATETSGSAADDV